MVVKKKTAKKAAKKSAKTRVTRVRGTGHEYAGPAHPSRANMPELSEHTRDLVRSQRQNAWHETLVWHALRDLGYTGARMQGTYIAVSPGLFVYPEGVRYFSPAERAAAHILGEQMGLPVRKLQLSDT